MNDMLKMLNYLLVTALEQSSAKDGRWSMDEVVLDDQGIRFKGKLGGEGKKAEFSARMVVDHETEGKFTLRLEVEKWPEEIPGLPRMITNSLGEGGCWATLNFSNPDQKEG